ncbi:hypothetical protein [Pseudomonas sp. R5(2019)]|uniref:hypothetical protein n=1 Tax=Pseudomonas sp. R5(2019) TaxID=2697566 RepID=UPI0014123EF1|nr:hypothetical protein [Pseudomonas sp. R5(2019)]NBA94997.1 hypothetical protein [Pseudomonas sp. R5(2019)]
MRITIDAESIISAFSGNYHEFEDSIRSAILAITPLIMDDYEAKILLDGSGFGKEWLNRVYGNPVRMRMVTGEELEDYDIPSSGCLESHYVGAAYHHGHHMILGRRNSTYAAVSKKYGIRNLSAPVVVDPSNPIGVRIIESHLLNSATSKKHSIIRDFFHQENSVVVYDRYLKEASLVLLETLLRQVSPCAVINIISEFEANSVYTAEDVCARLKKVRPHADIHCLYPNFKEQSDKHDRHIHLGCRLQISFSSGLDCFGLAPGWNNSECDIHVYYLDSESPVRRYAVKRRPTDKKGFFVEACSKI